MIKDTDRFLVSKLLRFYLRGGWMIRDTDGFMVTKL